MKLLICILLWGRALDDSPTVDESSVRVKTTRASTSREKVLRDRSIEKFIQSFKFFGHSPTINSTVGCTRIQIPYFCEYCFSQKLFFFEFLKP